MKGGGPSRPLSLWTRVVYLQTVASTHALARAAWAVATSWFVTKVTMAWVKADDQLSFAAAPCSRLGTLVSVFHSRIADLRSSPYCLAPAGGLPAAVRAGMEPSTGLTPFSPSGGPSHLRNFLTASASLAVFGRPMGAE